MYEVVFTFWKCNKTAFVLGCTVLLLSSVHYYLILEIFSCHNNLKNCFKSTMIILSFLPHLKVWKMILCRWESIYVCVCVCPFEMWSIIEDVWHWQSSISKFQLSLIKSVTFALLQSHCDMNGEGEKRRLLLSLSHTSGESDWLLGRVCDWWHWHSFLGRLQSSLKSVEEKKKVWRLVDSFTGLRLHRLFPVVPTSQWDRWKQREKSNNAATCNISLWP